MSGKHLIFLSIFGFLSSFSVLGADTFVLDAETVVLESNTVVLRKIDLTPPKLTVRVPVPFSVERCQEDSWRLEFGPNGPQCGYDIVSADCEYVGGECVPASRLAPRSCSHKVCAMTVTETETVFKDFEINFEEYPRDEDFEFSLDAGGKVVLMPLNTSPGCTSLVVYGGGPYVSGAKISLKSGWFGRACF